MHLWCIKFPFKLIFLILKPKLFSYQISDLRFHMVDEQFEKSMHEGLAWLISKYQTFITAIALYSKKPWLLNAYHLTRSRWHFERPWSPVIFTRLNNEYDWENLISYLTFVRAIDTETAGVIKILKSYKSRLFIHV